MKRTASAVWNGDLKTGKGSVSTASGVLSRTQYSFGTRFESGVGTNPEELVAAAHAGCFTMALSAQLGEAMLVPQSLETQATLTFEKQDVGWTVTGIHLDVTGRVPGRRQRAGLSEVRGCRQGGLSDLSAAEHADHDGRKAGELAIVRWRCLGRGRMNRTLGRRARPLLQLLFGVRVN